MQFGRLPAPGHEKISQYFYFFYRNARKDFEKYAEPLLHLAGFLVSVVKTEKVSEARDLAGIIDKTNIIAVAGGDGTIFEVCLPNIQNKSSLLHRITLHLMYKELETQGERIFPSLNCSQTVTGLMRREDFDDATKRFPLAVIPVGTQNYFAKNLFDGSFSSKPEFIAESTMAIIRHNYCTRDVLEIKVPTETVSVIEF